MNKEYVFIGGRMQGKTRDLIHQLIKENKELKNTIDKAIEYIDKHIRVDAEYPAYMELLIEERNELLEILKGESNEQRNII